MAEILSRDCLFIKIDPLTPLPPLSREQSEVLSLHCVVSPPLPPQASKIFTKSRDIFSPFFTQISSFEEEKMREIVTIQVGDFANYIGSHFWNFQVNLVFTYPSIFDQFQYRGFLLKAGKLRSFLI